MIKMGFRTRQRRVLESKMNELRMQSGISTKVIQHYETKQEKIANSEPSQKCWKRRFSVATNAEYFEHLDTGKVQWSAPASFGGMDEVEDLEEEKIKTGPGEPEPLLSTFELLREFDLSNYAGEIEALFGNDLNSITKEWMNLNLSTLPQRRLKMLIAKQSSNLWYSGRTADCNWWMNATTDEVLYYRPKVHQTVVVPVPKNYFDEPPKQEVSRGKRNWKKATSLIKTTVALNRAFKSTPNTTFDVPANDLDILVKVHEEDGGGICYTTTASAVTQSQKSHDKVKVQSNLDLAWLSNDLIAYNAKNKGKKNRHRHR